MKEIGEQSMEKVQWGVALLTEITNGIPRVIKYPSEAIATVAARSWHANQNPFIVVSRDAGWHLELAGASLTLDEIQKIIS